MRKMIKISGIAFLLMCSVVIAEEGVDFESLMEAVDNNSHNLQSSLVNKDAAGSIALAKDIENEFKIVGGFFAKRGNAPDAVEDAQKYVDLAVEVVKFVEANDFDNATLKSSELTKHCEDACHDTYKPL